MHKATGHKDVALAQLSDHALMSTLNFPDTFVVTDHETKDGYMVDYSPTRQAIRDWDALTRMIREYGPTVSLQDLQSELLALVRDTAQAFKA